MFERVVAACIATGLVGGEGFAVDASLIEADANKQRSIPGSEWNRARDLATANHAVKEYLATLDDAAFGAASEVTPKFVSPSDPAAQWTGAMRGPAFFAYADNYLIDVSFGIIVDVEASRAIRQAEVGAARTMIDRTEKCFGLKPNRLAADTAYGSAPMLNWLVEERQIAPHIPVIDKSQREDGTFSRSDFKWKKRLASTSARTTKCSEQVARFTTTRRCSIEPPNAIAMSVRSRCAAAPRSHLERSPATFMRMPAMLRAHSRTPRPLSSHGAIANAWRCCSRT